MKDKVILQGGGEHARVVLDALLDEGRDVVALFDPKYDGALFGIPQEGAYSPDLHAEARAIVAIGDNVTRKNVAALTRHTFTNAIHPSSIISSRAVVGTGNMILHGTIIQAQARIGDHVIVNTGSSVDHDCVIGDYVHLAPGTVICGTVTIGEGAFIGAGAIIIPGRKVGAWATIGAGAVVIDDIPDFAVAVGNPARVIRYTNQKA